MLHRSKLSYFLSVLEPKNQCIDVCFTPVEFQSLASWQLGSSATFNQWPGSHSTLSIFHCILYTFKIAWYFSPGAEKWSMQLHAHKKTPLIHPLCHELAVNHIQNEQHFTPNGSPFPLGLLFNCGEKTYFQPLLANRPHGSVQLNYWPGSFTIWGSISIMNGASIWLQDLDGNSTCIVVYIHM